MPFLDYFNLGDKKYKALFSQSTKSGILRVNSTTGQLGFYDTKAEALIDIKKRLPETIYLYNTVGSATLYKRVDNRKPAKWNKVGKYTINIKTGALRRL